MSSLQWSLCAFDELDTRSLYDILRLRCQVFIVEQQCPYPDIDDLDTTVGSRHATARAGYKICAYGRSLPPESSADAKNHTRSTARIGRIVVDPDYRRQGVGDRLLSILLADLASRFPEHDAVLDAQLAAMSLYSRAGFVRASEEFLEDGIAHVTMRRSLR